MRSKNGFCFFQMVGPLSYGFQRSIRVDSIAIALVIITITCTTLEAVEFCWELI